MLCALQIFTGTGAPGAARPCLEESYRTTTNTPPVLAASGAPTNNTCTYCSASPRSRRNTEAQSRKNHGAPECCATDLKAAAVQAQDKLKCQICRGAVFTGCAPSLATAPLRSQYHSTSHRENVPMLQRAHSHSYLLLSMLLRYNALFTAHTLPPSNKLKNETTGPRWL